MFKTRFAVSLAALMAVSFAFAQEPKAADPEACAKRCQEMKASHQKAMEARQAAWKEIEAQLEVARKARGDQKVAALESAVEKLVAFQAPGSHAMADCPMMGGSMHGSMHGKGHAGGGMDCCGGGMKGCCGGDGPAAGTHHCPMMKGETGAPEAPKPSN